MLAGVALTETERALLVAMMAAFASISVAILTATAAYLSAKRERRRSLYGECVKAAIAWVELLYRVRRRGSADEAASALDERFHEAQESLAYYSGWVGSDSKFMARSYRTLVSEVKAQTSTAIQDAWGQEGRAPGSPPSEGDVHPDISAAVDRFLRDVRSHLSWQPWRKLAFAYRNRAKS